MKKQVKKFGEFVNEARREHELPGFMEPGIAVWKIMEGPFGTFSTVSYGGEQIELEDSDDDYDEDGNFLGWRRVFRAANELGANSSKIFSAEDNEIIYKEDVM